MEIGKCFPHSTELVNEEKFPGTAVSKSIACVSLCAGSAF